ncbi:hypothetical protein [Verrucomicrobium sp. GAS474]|uniref:tetratricopeptide repeat protein n=1 Tax=Verrucomicrobium sp. GAS474 TaxID=1882831 RepID=UPI0012FF92A7|nr:hypothetical protein [Verrucomicrobium sp. GAS474]
MKSENELEASQLDLWKRAKSAADTNNRDYAISLIQNLLKVEPGFNEGRRYLRQVEIAKYKTLSAMSKKLNDVKTMAGAMRASGAVKKNPLDAIVSAEEVLALDPYHEKANEVLFDAGQSLELYDISVLAYETAAEGNPKKTNHLQLLANLCLKIENYEKAIWAFEKIVAIEPRNTDAQSGLKNATARFASKSGGWNDAKDFRGALKSKDESARIEQESKVAKSADAVAEQIARLYQQSQDNPTNLNFPKQIAGLYDQIGDYENAVAWYEHTYNSGGATDASLEKIIENLKLKQIDKQIADAAANVAASGNDQAWVDYHQQLVDYKKQLFVETAKKRVEKYPTEKKLHYELGKAYADIGMYREALPCLQTGKQEPSVRTEAANLLGLCQWKLGMFDMAEKGLAAVAAEIPVMNDVKKDVLYNLGGVLEGAGKKAEAIDVLKQIYEVDIGYRDVAARVEASYG